MAYLPRRNFTYCLIFIMYVYYRFNSSIHQSLTRIDVLGSLWAWDAANRGMPAIYARPITTLPSPPGHISAPVTCVSLGLCFSFLSVSHTQFLCGSTVPTACLHPQRGEEPRIMKQQCASKQRRKQLSLGFSQFHRSFT